MTRAHAGRPFRRRMRCNIEVDDLTSVMQQDYETVQVAEGQRRNGEEVFGRDSGLPRLSDLVRGPSPVALSKTHSFH